MRHCVAVTQSARSLNMQSVRQPVSSHRTEDTSNRSASSLMMIRHLGVMDDPLFSCGHPATTLAMKKMGSTAGVCSAQVRLTKLLQLALPGLGLTNTEHTARDQQGVA